MKYLFVLFFFSFLMCGYGQSKNILGVGVERMNYRSTDNRLSLSDNSFEGLYFGYEWVNNDEEPITLGIEGRYALNGSTYYDASLKIGYLLNKGKRLQFPVLPYGGYYLLKDAEVKHSGFIVGLQAGPRFYLTDNLSIEATYHYTFNFVSFEGDNSYEEMLPIINMNGINIGLKYYLKTGKN